MAKARGEVKLKPAAIEFMTSFLRNWNNVKNYKKKGAWPAFVGFVKDLPPEAQANSDAWRDAQLFSMLRDRLGLGHIPGEVKGETTVRMMAVKFTLGRLRRAVVGMPFQSGALSHALAAPTAFDAGPPYGWFHPTPAGVGPGRTLDLRPDAPEDAALMREALALPFELTLDDVAGLGEVKLTSAPPETLPGLRLRHQRKLRAEAGRDDFPKRAA